MPSDGYFASHAFRGGTMPSPRPPNSRREAIERDIMKELIREEILSGEIAERRILEEEVRREIEMERIMRISRFQSERCSGFAGTSGMVMHGDRYTQTLISSWQEARRSAFRGWEISHDATEFGLRENPLTRILSEKTMAVTSQPTALPNLEKPSSSNETAIMMSCKLSGSKRKKAPGESLLSAKKQWGCVLCQITVTCQENLKVHIQGKNHKEKEAILHSNNNKMNHLQVKDNATLPSEEGASVNQPIKKKSTKGKKQNKILCRLCKVKCNSQLSLNCHLSGKKHKSFMRLKKANINFKTREAVKETNDRTEDGGSEGSIQNENETSGLSKLT